MRSASRTVLALAAGLALADASIVALALPPLLRELDTTVEGVAAVLGVYVLVLAAALPLCAPLERRHGAARVGAAGFALFAAASVVCAVSGSLPLLLAGRALQAAGGAAGLVAVFTLIDAGETGRRLWVAAAVFGTATGPALGGLLTQLLDWQAIFVAQIPVAVAAAIVAARSHSPAVPAPARSPFPAGPAAALALVSAALTAVLFLLVLELIAGWSTEPLAAALAVTVLPVCAILAARIPGEPAVRATAGALLIGAGTGALAFLPDASVAWVIVPQILAGAGMGLALPALAGELLPERTAGDAARLLSVRHAGIVGVLILVAPLVSHQLDEVTHSAREQGVALVLDARLPPQDKLPLAPALLTGVNTENPRDSLRSAIDGQRDSFQGDERAEFDRLAERADDVLVAAVGDAFDEAFLIAAALGVLAALVLVVSLRLPARLALVAAALALLAVPAYAAARDAVAPEPVEIADPCGDRKLPETGGIAGQLQDTALRALDRTACKNGSSREELVLALADPDEADRYERVHGVNPRSLSGVLQALFG